MVAHTRADSAPKPTDPALAGARILVVEARYYDAIAARAPAPGPPW